MPGLVAGVERQKRLDVVGVGSAEAGEVFRTDRTLGDDRCWPFHDRAVVDPQPDVRQHPGPAAVSVAEGVNLHRSVVNQDSLFEDVGHVRLPPSDVVAQLGQVLANVAGGASWRQRPVSNLARPRPDVAKHLAVEPEHPAEIVRGNFAGWNTDEIANNGPSDVLRLSKGKLSAGANMPLSQAIKISERRFAVSGHYSISPQRLAAGCLQFTGGAIDHGIELVPRKTLSLER